MNDKLAGTVVQAVFPKIIFIFILYRAYSIYRVYTYGVFLGICEISGFSLRTIVPDDVFALCSCGCDATTARSPDMRTERLTPCRACGALESKSNALPFDSGLTPSAQGDI